MRGICCFTIIGLASFACTKTVTIKPANHSVIDAVFASGYLVLEHEYIVTANTEGYLSKANVEEGDSVTVGMPLFKLSSDVQDEQLLNARVNYQDALDNARPTAPERQQVVLQLEQAKVQLALDKKNHARYANLLKTGAVAQQEFDQAELQYENSKHNVVILEKSLDDLDDKLALNLKNAETQLTIQQENHTDYFLTSSIQGKVLHVFKEQGELVRRGEAIAKIGGGKTRVKLFVAEEDINRVKLGQQVLVSLNTDKDHLLTATTRKLYPAFDDVEQSFIVEASFDQTPSNLFANTQLQANIIIDEKDEALVMPSEYLTYGDSVYLFSGGKRYVEVGIRSKEWVEILAGIDENTRLQLPKR